MSEQKRRVALNGALIEGEAVGLQTSGENWSEYLLSDGSVLRLKIVALEATRIDGHYESDGTPTYAVKYHVVQHISAADSLKKLPS